MSSDHIESGGFICLVPSASLGLFRTGFQEEEKPGKGYAGKEGREAEVCKEQKEARGTGEKRDLRGHRTDLWTTWMTLTWHRVGAREDS